MPPDALAHLFNAEQPGREDYQVIGWKNAQKPPGIKVAKDMPTRLAIALRFAAPAAKSR